MSGDENKHLQLAGRPADYQKLGIDPVDVAQFEDGQRIGTGEGCYQWWYFDAHLDDGATVVVVFYTKPNVSPNGPLAARITINLTLPDGRRIDKLHDTTPDQFTASKEGCDVRIGTNRFVGDLRRYRITAAIEEISVEIELTGELRAWRPKSGHIHFGAGGREDVRLAPVGARKVWRMSATKSARISRLRQRLPRSQLGRCPHADADAQLVLGAGQGRSLHGHHLPHHGHQGIWLRDADRLHVGEGRGDDRGQ
jgi:hypothetical protein